MDALAFAVCAECHQEAPAVDVSEGVCYACWQTWEEMSSAERHAWHMGEVA